MPTYDDFVKQFERVLEEGEKKWLQHEQRRFLETFATEHGPNLIAGLERLLQPLLQSHIKLIGDAAKPPPPGGHTRGDNSGDNGGDRFERRGAEMVKADALTRQQYEIESRIRTDLPDVAEKLIGQLRELIDTAFYEPEGS